MSRKKPRVVTEKLTDFWEENGNERNGAGDDERKHNKSVDKVIFTPKQRLTILI